LDAIGLIAGGGELPQHVARQAHETGRRLVVIAFPGFTEPFPEDLADDIHWLKPGQLGKAIDLLKARGITRVVMAGKIEKVNLMRPWKLGLDRRAFRLIRSLKDWRDDTILAGIAAELAQEGISVDEITGWAGSIMASHGVLTKRKPTEEEWRDIEFGRAMAQGIGALDIGQTVVVKNSAVLVVEAIEGTDRAVRRTVDLGIEGAVVVKMAKPSQDMRFDVPGIGPTTIESLVHARAGVLAVEIGKTMISNREETIRRADTERIVVVGIPATGPVR
jgi:hypothetical protein